jgi:hypothetical protein
MEINENSLNFKNTTPKRVEQKAEAFLNLADLEDNASMLNTQEIPTEKVEQPAPQAPAPTERELVRNSLNLGPSYLTALDIINSKADLRAFETDLPIMNISARVSPLTGREEQSLKSASSTVDKFLMELNKVLFKHISFDGRTFTNMDEFLGNIFPPDKNMLVWALMMSSYLSLPEMEGKCEKCSENFIIDMTPQDLIHDDSLPELWDKSVPASEYSEIQTTMNGYLTFEISLPSEKKRLIVTSLLESSQAKDNLKEKGNLFDSVNTLAYFIKSITVGEDENRVVLTDIGQDIIPFLKNLPPKITDAIRSDIDISVFDKYMPNFYLNAECKHCNHINQIKIDPEITFFRKTIHI